MLFLSHHLKEIGFKIGENGVLKEFGGLGRNLGHNHKHGTEKEDGIGKTWTEFGPNHLTALRFEICEGKKRVEASLARCIVVLVTAIANR